MMNKALHIIIHDIASIALNIVLFQLFYSIDQKSAVIIAGLYISKVVASFVYSYEKAKEDKEAMDELEKILNNKKDV